MKMIYEANSTLTQQTEGYGFPHLSRLHSSYCGHQTLCLLLVVSFSIFILQSTRPESLISFRYRLRLRSCHRNALRLLSTFC